MANDFYNHANFPGSRASLSSAAMSAELESIQQGFDKIAPLTGYGGYFLRVNAGGTAYEAITAAEMRSYLALDTYYIPSGAGVVYTDGTAVMTGDLQLGPGIGVVFEGVTADAYETTLTGGEPTADRAITLPDQSGVVALTTDLGANDPQMLENVALAASVAGNALTIALKARSTGGDPSAAAPVRVAFRKESKTDGGLDILSITSALSLTVPAGATLGTTDGQSARLYVTLHNDGGSPRLGIYNPFFDGEIVAMSGKFWTTLRALDESAPSDATAISTAADTAQGIYASAGVTAKAFRILGYIEISEVTAGTWASGPDKVQVMGPGVPRTGDRVQSVFVRNAKLHGDHGATVTAAMSLTAAPSQSDGAAEFLSCQISPASAINLLRVRGGLAGGPSVAATVVASIFQDAETSPKNCVMEYVPASVATRVDVDCEVRANTAIATTFRLRAGTNTGSYTCNGYGGATKLGGYMASHIEVEEIHV